ncbi:MAG TPA: beta-galactosidase trimerization domain-containing protein [Candidatus Ratteibacteria bacterium]|nr:beta-galactosidase trimerization domain-containing protein [Candidatus Ratteibacteria bacterium]
MEWWKKEPLRVIEIAHGYEINEKMKVLKELNANMEHLTRYNASELFPSEEFSLHSGILLKPDDFDKYLKEAHTIGVKVVFYYNVHAVNIQYAKKRPDWQQICEDGKAIDNVYETYSSFCVNSGWRNEVFEMLKKICKFGFDGIFYDGPIFFANTCYCESCKRLFKGKYGYQLPQKTSLSKDRENSQWKDIIEFQSDAIERFLEDSNNVIKSVNPSVLFYMNCNTLAPTWPTGRNNRKIIRKTDILGAEGGFLYYGLNEPIYKPGATAKFLNSQAYGKPAVVFCAGKQCPWNFSILPKGEITLFYTQTITHGANVWLALCVDEDVRKYKQQVNIIKRFNKFIKENPSQFIDNTSSCAKTLLIFPQRSLDFYEGSSVPLTDFTKEIKGEKAGNLIEEFYGFYDSLVRVHIPFDVSDEEGILNIENDKYDLIIFPNAVSLADKEIEKIEGFVKDGGNIISSFETSSHNYGKRLEKFKLGKILGIDDIGKIFGPLRWDSIFIDGKIIFSPEYGIEIKTKGKIISYFAKPLPGSYSKRPEISEIPFIVENKYGKGKSIYFAGTIGSSIYKYHFPEYYKLLSSFYNSLSRKILEIENAPTSLEISIRENEKFYYIYFINFTSEMKRPIEEIMPIRDIKVKFFTNSKIGDVYSLWNKEKLTFKKAKGKIIFNIPIIKEYEIIRVKKEEK